MLGGRERCKGRGTCIRVAVGGENACGKGKVLGEWVRGEGRGGGRC